VKKLVFLSFFLFVFCSNAIAENHQLTKWHVSIGNSFLLDDALRVYTLVGLKASFGYSWERFSTELEITWAAPPNEQITRHGLTLEIPFLFYAFRYETAKQLFHVRTGISVIGGLGITSRVKTGSVGMSLLIGDVGFSIVKIGKGFLMWRTQLGYSPIEFAFHTSGLIVLALFRIDLHFSLEYRW